MATTARPSDAKTADSAEEKLAPEDEIPYRNLKGYYKRQTELCQKETANTTLTPDEFKTASPEFQNLVQIPRDKGEPIYIMPESDPRIAKVMAAIQAGKPYHTFITNSLGITWPILLRLLLGLKSGFKISMDQFHSMMKVCYWRDLGLKVENVPFKSNAGDVLMQSGLYFSDEKSRAKFLTAMSDSRIPPGERFVQVVELNADYFRIVKNTLEAQSPDKMSENTMVLNIYDTMFFAASHGPYNAKKSHDFMVSAGARMFSALIHGGTGYYKIVFLEGKPCLVIPSQTMRTKYIEIVNPKRRLKISRKLGRCGPSVYEKASDNNERITPMYAPGITNSLKDHGKVVPPALAQEHEDYHALFETLLKRIIFLQMTRGKNIYRRIFNEDGQFTSEITRFIDRESSPEFSDEERFYNLLKYVFSLNLDDEHAATNTSSVIVLTDMIFNPSEWPFYELYPHLKDRLIDLLLHNTTEKTGDFINRVETVTREYGRRFNNDPAFVSILLLCRFHLNDEAFCNVLIDLKTRYPHGSICAWRKKDHGHLYPVLILNGKEYTFDKIRSLKPETRNILWLSAKLTASPPVPASTERKVATSDIVAAEGTAPVTTVTAGGTTSQPLSPVLELKLRDGEIRIQIPDFNDDKKTIISENKGNVVQEPGADNIATITIESAVLKKGIRDRLGIDRVIIPLVGNTDEKLTYLKQNGIVIETTREPNKFMLTFARNGRALIQKVANHWGEIVASRATERLKA